MVVSTLETIVEKPKLEKFLIRELENILTIYTSLQNIAIRGNR